MPFRRRVPLNWKNRLHDLVWPRIGLRRAMRVHWNRLHRLPGTPTSIAAGFAWGLGISVTPLVGAHIILGALVAWLTRSNVLAAAIAAFAVNPWTAPPVWFATYYVGSLMEGADPTGEGPAFATMFTGLAEAVWLLDWQIFMAKAWPVFRPMFLGSVPIGLAAGLAAYALLKPALARFQAGRHQRMGAAARHRTRERTDIRH